MPRDLLAEQQVSTASAPKDLLAGSTSSNQQQPNAAQPLWARLAGDVDIGATRMGLGVRSAPHYIAQMLAQHGLISPETAAKATLPNIAFNLKGLTAPLQGKQIGQAYGVTKPNIADKLLQGAAQYAPYALVGGASLPGQAAAGGLYGATQSKDPITGAATGAATNLILGKVGQIISKGVPSITKALSKYAAPGIADTLKSSLDKVKDLKNSVAFDRARSNFNDYQDAESSAWDSLKKSANAADAQSGINFNDENYKDALTKKIADLKKESVQSGFERKNEDSIGLLKDYVNDPHSSFADAIEHNRALNADYQNEVTPGKSMPFSMINYSKKNLKNAIQENLSKNNLQNTLGSSWSKANKATADKNSIFNEIVSPAGKPQISSFMKYYKGGKDYSDPSTFIDQYVPKTAGEGTQKMEQFSNMVGDKKYSKDILKMNYFKNSYNKKGFDSEAFLKKYNNLSSEQKSYLFTTDQKNKIGSLNKILSKDPNALKKPSLFGGFGWYHSFPALVGLGLGQMAGHPYEGLGAGVVGSRLIERQLQSLFKNPKLQAAAVKSLSSPEKDLSLSKAVGKLLSSRLASSLSTPTAASYMGGQS